MGVKKKLEDLLIKVLIEMGGKKMTVSLNCEDFLIKATRTFRHPKQDDGDPPGFHDILSAPCEFMRQILDHPAEIPPDLLKKIKSMISTQTYFLLLY